MFRRKSQKPIVVPFDRVAHAEAVAAELQQDVDAFLNEGVSVSLIISRLEAAAYARGYADAVKHLTKTNH